MRRYFFIVLAATLKLFSTSSITVDWSSKTIPDAVTYILDYAPAVGSPPAGSALERTATKVLIKDTMPACEYTIYLSAIMPDGKRSLVLEDLFYSSPDPPILDSIETTKHEATISYFPPKETNVTFHIEYYPEEQPEYANMIDTKASLVKLRGLDSGTAFRIKIRSIYNGVPSTEIIETSFQTDGTPDYDYSYSGEVFTVQTLPPGLNLATVEPNEYDELEDSNKNVIITVPPPKPTSRPETINKDLATPITTPTTTPTTTTVQVFDMAAEPSLILTSELTTSAPIISPSTLSTQKPKKNHGLNSGSSVSSRKAVSGDESDAMSIQSIIEKPKEVVVETGDDGSENYEALPVQKMISEFGEPTSIIMSPMEDKIRLDWSVPEGSLCEAFFVNYTILTLTRPKSYSVATGDEYTIIKFFSNHTLDIRVFCMIGGALSKTWWAHRIADLSVPLPIQSMRVLSSETDEFYVSRILVDWFWPAYHNFDLYTIVISYGIGKSNGKEIKVYEPGPVLLDKLEPSQTYHIAVRNESVELELKSKPTEIERITPPLISSMISPGKITSTSINVNFEESDLDQGRFDYYELVFTGNNKNITKKIEINQDKSLTFTKLIPGKTYDFSLYTVYKGKRSRPVTEAITTYPLKVTELLPVVGREYVVLYWDVENFADSDVRFRLSYNADKIPTVSVELKGGSRHRFSNLQTDVYYTFTITVIMGTGKAAAESESEMITVYVPKAARLSPSLVRLGSRELKVSFENDQQVFSPLNGDISNIAVIVTDDTELNDDIYELKSWFEVREEETWGSYRASPSDWNPFTRNVRNTSFTIGSDDCVRRSLDEPYCNGILRANTDYKVKIRAYMQNKIAMESDWIIIDGTEEANSEEDDKYERRHPCHMYLNGCPRKSTLRMGQSLIWLWAITVAMRLL
ncbi:unnamed protein product [Cylicocyclus nassatus]|uniref:protein-tyrosine-phosphatase n=1 Tax=Cylicocyclus nassatus TaxID=53992 RepID=A0AA36H6R8_CYLNA|nr:unnamed protein product [Cylicocyclus nassatus]